MKKLMIAAVAALAVGIVNAATIAWGSAGIQTTGDFDSGDGDYAANYAVYLFSSDVTVDFGSDTWKSNFEGTGTYLGKGVTDADGSLNVNTLTVDDGNFSGYLVIFDTDSYDNASYAFVSGEYTAADNSMHKMTMDYDGDTWVNALDYSTKTGWTQLESVPEPTSGLLLLLGVAGLALRRKQA